MPHRQHHDLFPVVVIQGYIGPTSEFNYPLAKLRRQFFDWTADLRMLAESLYSLPDCLNGATGCILALGSEKVMEASHIQQGGLRPLQAWHFGGLAFFPASSLASQASASSAVAWRPVAS